MRPNPVSFLLLSMVLGILLMTLVVVGILTVDLNIEREYSRTTLDAQGMEHISIDNTLGEVSVHGEDRQDILIEVRKETYFGKDTLERIDVDISTGSGVNIKVDADNGIFLYTVEIDVWMPSGLFLRGIYLEIGSVTVDSVSHVGVVDVKTGDMVLNGIGTIQRMEMDSGNIEIDRVGSVGMVRIDNGELDMQVWSIGSNGTSIEMDNGDMTIRVPQNLSFDISLKVDSGEIAVKNLGVEYDTDRNTSKKGRVIDGGALLTCDLDSGSITVVGEVIE